MPRKDNKPGENTMDEKTDKKATKKEASGGKPAELFPANKQPKQTNNKQQKGTNNDV